MAEILTGIAIILIVTSFTLLATQKLRIPRYTAYILSGVISAAVASKLASYGSDPLVETSTIIGIAEAGAAFLVFVTAVRLFTHSQPETRADAIKISSIQILVQITLGAIIGYSFGLDLVNSVFIGLAAGISSSLVSTQILEREISHSTRYGKLTESITFIDDYIAAVLIAVVLSGAATGSILLAAVSAAIIFLAYIAQPLGSRLIRQVSEEEEVLLMVGIGSVALAGYFFSYIGGNSVVGAFAAGVFFSKEPTNLKLLESLEPVKDFFAALFFVSLGFLLDLPGGIGFLILITLLFSVSIARPIIIAVLARTLGYNSYDSVKTSLHLDQISEFVLLAALVGLQAGWLAEDVFQAIVAAGAITMITAELTTKKSDWIFEKVPDRFKPEKQKRMIDAEDHMILVGYSNLGKSVAKLAENVVVIDEDPEKVSEARQDGFKAIEGSVQDASAWGRANVRNAKAVVSASGKDRDAESSAYQGLPCVLLTSTSEKAEELQTFEHVESAGSVEDYSQDSLVEQVDRILEEHQSGSGF